MKMLKNTIHFFKALARPFPTRDWYITLGLSGVLALVLIALSGYLFVGIQSGAIIAPKGGDTPSSVSVSRESLKTTLEAYTVRTLNFEARNYTVPNVSDPAR